MNRSNKFIALLLAAGLSVLAAPVFAQSSAPAPGAQTDPDLRTPPSLPPGQSALGENPIVYGPRGVITGTRVDEPGGIGFDELDRDRDGRISLAEFTQSSAVDSRASAAPGGGDGESTGGRSGATTGISGGNEGAEHRASAFSQLDRDRDGYLTRDEMDAGKRNSAGRIVP